MTEKRYTLITIAPIEHGKPSRLQFETSMGIGQLLCSQPSRLHPGESVIEAHDHVRGFDAKAQPGDHLLGLDQAIVCERASLDNDDMKRDPFDDGGRDWHRMDPVDAPEQSKSPAEVEELKRQWLADPCWDIEGTPGFEAHAAELIEWKLRDNIAALEADVASLRAQLAAKRPRLFEFANGSEVDVDRYLALDATAREHVATFQLHHSYHRVYFDSDEQRASELERMRAFRDGRAS